MARDIKMIWDNDFLEGDIAMSNGDLLREEGLETAVLISLFTDARADEDDEIDNPDNKRGWWGDIILNDTIGSKLWLLDRSKTTQTNLTKAEQYTREALQWMIDDLVVTRIEVKAERSGDIGNDIIGLKIELYKSDGSKTTLKFDDLWKGEFYAL